VTRREGVKELEPAPFGKATPPGPHATNSMVSTWGGTFIFFLKKRGGPAFLSLWHDLKRRGKKKKKKETPFRTVQGEDILFLHSNKWEGEKKRDAFFC